MSPQIKRTAIGGFVIAMTLLLVLSAVAVAQRDARNKDSEPVERNPEYARQEVQPMAIPAGMVNRLDELRQFPHGDVHAANDLRPAETANSAITSLARSSNDPPSIQFISKPESQETQTSPSNPLRQPTASAIEASESAENDSLSTEPNLIESDEEPASIDAIASDDPEASNSESASLASWQQEIEETETTTESSVVPAGYDMPPTSPPATSSRSSLQPPPLPTLGPNTQLPPASQNSAGLLSPPTSFPSTSMPSGATLLPPASLPSSASSGPSLMSPTTTGSTMAVPANLESSNPNLPNTRAAQPMMAPPATMLPPTSLPNSAAIPRDPNSLTPPSANPAQPNLASPSIAYPSQLAPSSRTNATLTSSASEEQPFANPPSSPTQPSQRPTASLPTESTTLPPARMPSPSPMSRPQSNNTALDSSSLISDRPGERALDGVQTPNLQLLKEAPAEIQVGHPATMTILLKNVGKAAAHDVVVQDILPQGTKLQATNPPAQELADGRLIWEVGVLPAGGQQVMTIEVIPETEGELGSIASVRFAAQASVRTVATQPKLVIHQRIDPTVLIGEICKVSITVSNEGTGVAYDVKLQEDVPAGLRHPQGDFLGSSLNDLAPGQSRTVDLELEAADPGKQVNVIRVIAANTEEIVSEVPLEVVAPKLQVRADGPRLRYLERQATYNVTIGNLGTAMARNIELIAYLPRGLRFNSAGNRGEYLPDQHAVVWMLEELNENTEATTDLVVLPVEEGDFVLRFQTRADRATAEPFEKQVRVDGQSELAFSVEDDNDPIETDGQTTYLVRLNNIGTRQDSNVQITIDLPPGANLVSMSAPVEYQQRQDSIVFAPIPVLNPKDEKLLRFTVALSREGIQMMRATVKSDLRPLAVVKEESTQVYSDQ